jgi:hypothetical protein
MRLVPASFLLEKIKTGLSEDKAGLLAFYKV